MVSRRNRNGSPKTCQTDTHERDFLSSESEILWMAENVHSLAFTDRERSRGFVVVYANTLLMYGRCWMANKRADGQRVGESSIPVG